MRYGSNKPVTSTKGSGISVNQTTNNADATTKQGVEKQQNASGGSGGCNGCEPNVPYITSLIEFVSILESLKSSIGKYFPSVSVGMSIDGRFAASGAMDIRYASRIGWITTHKEREGRFDVTNIRHIHLLKDEFLKLGGDWRIDKWLRDWTPTPAPVAGGNTVTGAPATATRSGVAAT